MWTWQATVVRKFPRHQQELTNSAGVAQENSPSMRKNRQALHMPKGMVRL
jgi:hypothetical protein